MSEPAHLIVNGRRYATEGEAWEALRERHAIWRAEQDATSWRRGKLSYRCEQGWPSYHARCTGRTWEGPCLCKCHLRAA